MLYTIKILLEAKYIRVIVVIHGHELRIKGVEHELCDLLAMLDTD
ncbi:hypothetical protein [Frigidibacter mobilis]|nr:hypothetical protein [Frigidibacter mobilis]